MTIPAALASLKSAIAAFSAEKVTAAEIEDFLEMARVKRFPGEFEEEPSNSQMESFKRGER